MKLKIAKVSAVLGLIASLVLVNWNTNPIVLPNQYSGYNLTPRVAIGSEQHVVWTYTDYNFSFVSLLYAHASINGVWSAPYEIASYNKFSADKPSITVTQDNSVHVVYANPYGAVQHFEKVGNTWFMPVTIGSGFGASVTSNANEIYAVWSDIRNGQGNAYFNWRGLNWHTEKAVTANNTALNRGADIAFENGIVHIVSQQQVNGSYKVSYVRDIAAGSFGNDRLLAQELSAYDLSLGGGVCIEANPLSVVWGASVSDTSEPLAITQSINNGISFGPPIYADPGYNLLVKDPDVVTNDQKLYVTMTVLQWNGISVIARTVSAYHNETWTNLGTNPSSSSSLASGQNIVLASWSSTLGSNDYIFYNTQQLPKYRAYLPIIFK